MVLIFVYLSPTPTLPAPGLATWQAANTDMIVGFVLEISSPMSCTDCIGEAGFVLDNLIIKYRVGDRKQRKEIYKYFLNRSSQVTRWCNPVKYLVFCEIPDIITLSHIPHLLQIIPPLPTTPLSVRTLRRKCWKMWKTVVVWKWGYFVSDCKYFDERKLSER